MQALPVLRLIKLHLPHSEIFWWIDTKLAPLLEGDPDLAGIIHFDRQRWAAPRHWKELWHSVRWLRAQRFEWAIDLQSLARSGIFAWLTNAELTVGLDEAREGARGFYDLIARRASFHTHAVDWYLAALPLLRVPVHKNFNWLPERPALAKAVRAKWPIGDARWIILQPGARWVTKRWPADYFAELVQLLQAAHPDFRFAILGSADDAPTGQIIARIAPDRCLDLTGKLSLLEMVEWIRAAEMMISNDTGPMHVAAALGKPIVALFGPTEPRRTGPYGQLEHVLQIKLPCEPCFNSHCSYQKELECLRGIPPKAVYAAVEARLRQQRA